MAVFELGGEGQEGEGTRFKAVDELHGFEPGVGILMDGEDFVGIGFEDAEGLLDAAKDDPIGLRTGFGGAGIDPLMERRPEFHEAGAFVGPACDAIAGEGVIHFQDADLVVLGEIEAVVEGGTEGGESAGLGPRNPGAPPKEGGDGEDGGGEERNAAREIPLHEGESAEAGPGCNRGYVRQG